MAMRLLLVGLAAAAVGVGFLLPAPHAAKAARHSQFQALELGRR